MIECWAISFWEFFFVSFLFLILPSYLFTCTMYQPLCERLLVGPLYKYTVAVKHYTSVSLLNATWPFSLTKWSEVWCKGYEIGFRMSYKLLLNEFKWKDGNMFDHNNFCDFTLCCRLIFNLLQFDLKRWGSKGVIQSSGCITVCCHKNLENALDVMINTNGLKHVELMKRVWSGVYPRIWGGT